MRRRSVVVLSSGVLGMVLAHPTTAAGVCVQGSWAAFNHTTATQPSFVAVHASLIPVGNGQGKVLVWGFGDSASDPNSLAWAVVDAVTRTVLHNQLEQTMGIADLFCSAHAWTRDGRLFVAGGRRLDGPLNDVGSRETWIFDPTLDLYGRWIRQAAKLERARYYPTVVADTATNQMYVLGGGPTLNSPELTDFDDYEVFVPGTPGPGTQGSYQFRIVNGVPTQLYSGPANDTVNNVLPPSASSHRLFQYPRTYLLTTGAVANVGMTDIAARALHHPNLPTQWSNLGMSQTFRNYGSAVRFPNLTTSHENTILIVAGLYCNPPAACAWLQTVQLCNAAASQPGPWPGWDWTPAFGPGSLAPLNNARGCLNLVILPSGGILALGGQNGHPTSPLSWQQIPELFSGSVWTNMATEPSRRGYHATALLLSDGTVFSGGANIRDWDYCVFTPPNLQSPLPRPVLTTPLPNPNPVYDTWYTAHFALPPSVTVDRVVLMRPGSATHHWDADQRYVQLELDLSNELSDQVRFKTPLNTSKAPPGYWMLFLVTNAGTPSRAHWIQL